MFETSIFVLQSFPIWKMQLVIKRMAWSTRMQLFFAVNICVTSHLCFVRLRKVIYVNISFSWSHPCHIFFICSCSWNLQHVGLSFCNALSWMDKTELAKCHNMMTSSNRKILRVTGLLCGEFTNHWGILLHTKATDAELWCFFDLRLNGRLIEQSWGWWFETPSCSLWRHFNVILNVVWTDYLP